MMCGFAIVMSYLCLFCYMNQLTGCSMLHRIHLTSTQIMWGEPQIKPQGKTQHATQNSFNFHSNHVGGTQDKTPGENPADYPNQMYRYSYKTISSTLYMHKQVLSGQPITGVVEADSPHIQ